MFYVEKLTPNMELRPGKLLLNSSVYGWESSLGETLGTSSYNLPSGGYNVDFRRSLPLRFSEVDSLTLTIGTSNTPQQIHPSVWNFQTDTWQVFTLDSFGNAVIPNAWQYVGMDGEVLVNLQGDTNGYFDITSIDFTMMVQP
jgi:hypothetical protein